MKNKIAILISSFVFAFSSAQVVKSESITLGWAAWDPANALVELSKDFTAQTGIEVNFEFVPWPNFADRMLNELNNKGKTFDLLIGDSQWIGGGATYGHYVKLNDFFDKEGISMNDFSDATVYAYSTWPKGSENYYALPAMGDALAWAYRKDWFDRPELNSEFKAKHGYDLGVPKNWDELYDMCTFFQGREIDGQVRYGAAINTERGSEGITMGVTAAMYAWGMEYENPNKPYDMEGYFNAPNVVEALEFYRKMYEDCAPPGHSDAYMVANLDAYKSGQVAFQMNWYAFWPGVSKEDADGRVTGFFANPSQKVSAATLGGQGISVVNYSDKKDLALQYIKWFAQPDVQQKWWDLGGYSCHKDVLGSPDFVNSAVYAQGFLDSMGIVKDFWQEPTFVELMLPMQEHVHDYVVNGKGSAQEALDKIIEEWVEVFEADGKL
ncbi:MAG: extracellular solute-binding protein [Pseudomonadota bacterium]|jgi:multiple sugar transport system substrate-binding protein|nr:extracellular solute-binding protein [Pseudomonadota bacterium]|tara:strand:- start:2512 stop:3825 length:1314 start_codon:yes stop_codon:yes gene_type:complete